MNKKEAIEQLKIIKKNIDKKYINTKNSNAIETVLNLLEKKDEEIEKYKMMLAENCARTLNSNLKQKHKHEEDLEALHLGWKEEIEKKDKIIEEMAKDLIFMGTNNKLKVNDVKKLYERKVENGN